jgi:hypothetical protein
VFPSGVPAYPSGVLAYSSGVPSYPSGAPVVWIPPNPQQSGPVYVVAPDRPLVHNPHLAHLSTRGLPSRQHHSMAYPHAPQVQPPSMPHHMPYPVSANPADMEDTAQVCTIMCYLLRVAPGRSGRYTPDAVLHAPLAPYDAFVQRMHDIILGLRSSKPAIVHSLLYMHRLRRAMRSKGLELDASMAHATIFGGLMLGHKWVEDGAILNKSLAPILQAWCKNLLELERQCLGWLEHNLSVSKEEHDQWLGYLQELGAAHSDALNRGIRPEVTTFPGFPGSSSLPILPGHPDEIGQSTRAEPQHRSHGHTSRTRPPMPTAGGSSRHATRSDRKR